MVLLRGDGFDVDGDFVEVRVERVAEQPDLFDSTNIDLMSRR